MRARPSYAEYVKQALRSHARLATARTEAERLSERACRAALGELGQRERICLHRVYASRARSLPDAVAEEAALGVMGEGELWRAIGELERRVAELRGLV